MTEPRAGLQSTDFLLTFPIAGALAVGANVLQVPIPFATRVISVQATASTAPTGASALFDVHKGTEADATGVTIFTTQGDRPSVAAGNNVGAKATPDEDEAVFEPGDVLIVAVDQVGSTVAGSNAVLTLHCEKV